MSAAVQPIRSRATTPRSVPFQRSRFFIICLLFLIWVCAIAGRLFWLQIVRHQDFVERAAKQQERTFEVAPRRGILYDRNLNELAMTVLVDSVYADPSEIADKPAAARALSAIVHTDPEDSLTSRDAILDRINAGRNFAWIARRVTPLVSAAVKALDLKGIYFQKEFERFYPDNQLAAQALGYVGADDDGLGGLEEKFDGELHGRSGLMNAAVDARRKVLGSSERDPEPGRNLMLTIDENIQYMAERALDHAMQKTQALSGTVVVQDVHTGQILALAIRPTFNPNQFRHTNPALLRDHAVSDVYEPGSTFKLVTYAAAMDAKVATPDDMIDCQGGQINLYGRIIHDDKSDRGIGTVSVATALARSSDVGVIKVALKLGPDRLYNYIRAFGFGQRTGIELPGETRGLLRPIKHWQPASIGYVAIGQEEAVTPIQLVSMVSTIANGGTYLPPHILVPAQDVSPVPNPNSTPAQEPPLPPIGTNSRTPQVKQISDVLHPSPFKLNEDLPNPLPSGTHRVISELAAAEMRKMMEGVVLYGTGKPAQLDGYSSAGKTGTAQKIDPVTHLYSTTMHIASFVGFAPVNNPVISVAVVIDSPKGAYYGTEVSAPVFAEIAQEVLEYLGVPHDIDLRPETTASAKETPVTEDEDTNQDEDMQALYQAANDLPSDDPLRNPPAASSAAKAPAPLAQTDSIVPVSRLGAKLVSPPSTSASSAAPTSTSPPPTTNSIVIADRKQLRVPALIGFSMREVVEQAASAGLQVDITGDGIARQQAPDAGTMVPAGTRIVVRCSR
jgi:cell division protein FtsI (penicillin-binding protein 3)